MGPSLRGIPKRRYIYAGCYLFLRWYRQDAIGLDFCWTAGLMALPFAAAVGYVAGARNYLSEDGRSMPIGTALSTFKAAAVPTGRHGWSSNTGPRLWPWS